MTVALEEGERSAARPGRTLPPGKDPVPILQDAGWASGPVWADGKSRPHRDSIPDRPVRSQSLCRLSYRAHIGSYSDLNSPNSVVQRLSAAINGCWQTVSLSTLLWVITTSKSVFLNQFITLMTIPLKLRDSLCMPTCISGVHISFTFLCRLAFYMHFLFLVYLRRIIWWKVLKFLKKNK